MIASLGLAFAAPMGMIDGIHGDAALMRQTSEPPRAAGLTNDDVLVVDVGHLTDGRPAIQTHHSHFAGGKPKLRDRAFFGDQLRHGSCATDHFTPAPGLSSMLWSSVPKGMLRSGM